MAKNPNRRSKNMSNEALAALGLDVEDAATASAPMPVAEAAARADREEVEVGDIEVGEVDFIPTQQRGATGSKYKFAELAAPRDVNGKIKYSQFTVRLQPGVDELKLKRSVQSATTQENKKNKDRGDSAYYITRTINEGGKFVGIMVIRTDAPRSDESDAE